MNHDVFFYEAFEEEATSLAAELGPGVRAGYTASTIQLAGHTTPPAPLLSIRTQSALPPGWELHIRGVLARTTGYDHLLPLRHRAPNLALAALPEYCSRAVAEQAALLWMSLLRRLPAQLRQWATFHRDGLTGGECGGRTLAVAGVGRIGHAVTQIGRGLGMQVLGVDPVRRHSDVQYVAWEEAVARADVLALCMNLTAENRACVRRATLAGARPGLCLVNVARGELVETADLEPLLREGLLGGVALDVFAGEPEVADALRTGRSTAESARLLHLARHPQVILTPHNAFNTHEAVHRKSAFSARQVQTFLASGHFEWPLDA